MDLLAFGAGKLIKLTVIIINRKMRRKPVIYPVFYIVYLWSFFPQHFLVVIGGISHKNKFSVWRQTEIIFQIFGTEFNLSISNFVDRSSPCFDLWKLFRDLKMSDLSINNRNQPAIQMYRFGSIIRHFVFEKSIPWIFPRFRCTTAKPGRV